MNDLPNVDLMVANIKQICKTSIGIMVNNWNDIRFNLISNDNRADDQYQELGKKTSQSVYLFQENETKTWSETNHSFFFYIFLLLSAFSWFSCLITCPIIIVFQMSDFD